MSTTAAPSGAAALAALSADERASLDSTGFDAQSFAELVDGHLAGTLPPNRLRGDVQPPPAIPRVAPSGSWQGDALVDAGRQALHAGKAGLLLLNGGMATRFGGRVKGIVPALPGRSFLALQAERMAGLQAETGQPLPMLLMNSLATDEPTRAHLAEHDGWSLAAGSVRTFMQSAAPRLRPDGSLYRGADGTPSLYGPGHGDLLPSLRRSGELQRLRDAGVEVLLMANVDNLGAALDPALLGAFLASGAEMMVEVAPKLPGDVGGAPASVDGEVRIVEGFAFPEEFDQDRIPVFNTNTLWFRVDALDREFPLRWYRVRKKTGDDEVIQFERLVGQASWFLRTEYVTVSRDRFRPVKSPADLDAVRPKLREMFGVRLRVL
ncbi:MAG: UTP--glucose-1-phosphate uridylyltransferase [Deltaproteobacteria bacterium]|nr:UTP--glucose-1-phosphate uridylyltransferase [Deltaproteobacteria bacterium]